MSHTWFCVCPFYWSMYIILMPHDDTLITAEYDPPTTEGTGKKYGETYWTHRFNSNLLISILAGSRHREMLPSRMLYKKNTKYPTRKTDHFKAYNYFDYYIPTVECLKVPICKWKSSKNGLPNDCFRRSPNQTQYKKNWTVVGWVIIESE